MHASKLWAVGLTLCLITACNGRPSLKPASSARPYEVVVVGDSDSIVYHALSKDVPGLPQGEPMFDVQEISPQRLDATAQLARNIVVVEFDHKRNAPASVRHTKNRYAEPQLVVHLQGHTPSALAILLQKSDNETVRLLLAHERQAAISGLKAKHNPRAEQVIKQMFGIDMLIPADLLSSKTGKAFVWMSNNDGTTMKNICLYTLPLPPKGTMPTTAEIIAGRDSVMQINIKGETDRMYMRTVEGSARASSPKAKAATETFVSGLWEMQGDAMGGPFVARVLLDHQHQRIVVAEAFVFAPSMKKRNSIRRIESALYTIKLNTQK